MARPLGGRRRTETMALPGWIKPQLTRLVDQAPDGPDWLHEIKFDGYRMHARLDAGRTQILTPDAMTGPKNIRPSPNRLPICRRRMPTWTANCASAAQWQDRLQFDQERDRHWPGVASVLPLRPAVSRRREPDDTAVGGAQGPVSISAKRCDGLAAIQRSSNWAWPGLP